jgi:hypothetical protein
MGGTSAACPEVAGVAALLLSLNPALTPAQIFDAVTESADKVGGYTYAGGRCDQMGFGRLNAFNAVSARLWMQDTANDPGTEPNLTGDLMYISDDVWVRKTADGGVIHEDAEYRISGPPNAVYVKVRNAGNVSGSATLKVYWACASSGLGWPAPWDGSVTSPALMGNLIGSDHARFPYSRRRSSSTESPNPAVYSMFGAENHLPLESSFFGAPFGLTFPEKNSGKTSDEQPIVWKNIQVSTT